MRNVRSVGLDVHAQTIAVAVAETGGEVRSLGVIPNVPGSMSKLIKKLGKSDSVPRAIPVRLWAVTKALEPTAGEFVDMTVYLNARMVILGKLPQRASRR